MSVAGICHYVVRTSIADALPSRLLVLLKQLAVSVYEVLIQSLALDKISNKYQTTIFLLS